MKTRLTKNAKLARALALRDAALTVIGRIGKWEEIRVSRAVTGPSEIKSLSARLGNLYISYRTPFQRMPQPDDLLKYRAAQHSLPMPQNLPYGLDVWAPKKVLNIEWDDKGNIVIVSLHHGAWEMELITSAESKVLD